MPMKITIGAFDAEKGTVPVTFKDGGVTHAREVNAVRDADGGYDKAATKLRVEEVGRGVAAKIACGVLRPQ